MAWACFATFLYLYSLKERESHYLKALLVRQTISIKQPTPGHGLLACYIQVSITACFTKMDVMKNRLESRVTVDVLK